MSERKDSERKESEHSNNEREPNERTYCHSLMLNDLYGFFSSLNMLRYSNYVILLIEYVCIYRSIFDIIYWPIYDSRILTDICNFFQNHFLTDICRNLSFFDRYMKIFIFSKIAIFDFCSMFRYIKSSYIGQYKNPYIGQYKNVYKTLGGQAYIDRYTTVKPRSVT